MPEFQPPEGLLNLPFGDLKGELDKGVETALTLLNIVEKFMWLPQFAVYKVPLNELIKLLTVLNNFLDKTP